MTGVINIIATNIVVNDTRNAVNMKKVIENATCNNLVGTPPKLIANHAVPSNITGAIKAETTVLS